MKPNRTILIVDDFAADRALLRRLLARDAEHEYRFLEAENGAEALEICQTEIPDCVLLDYELPDMNGAEILQKIIAEHGANRIPVVMLSGSSNLKIAVAALKTGAHDYLVKDRLRESDDIQRAVSNAIEKVNLERERRTAQDKLRVSEERLILAMTGANIGAFDWNIKTGAIEWTQEIEEAAAMSAEEFDNSFEGFLNVVHPQDRELLQQRIEAAFTDGEYECEFRMLKGDGTMRWVIGKGNVFFDDEGKPARLVGVDIDITKRKLAEEELLENQQFTESIIETAPNVLYMFDIAQNCNTFLTAQASTALGYPFEDLKNAEPNFIAAYMHPDDAPQAEKHFQTIAQSQNGEVFEFEYRMLHKSGEWRWFRSRDKVFRRDEKGKPQEILGIALDITERKQAADDLRESDERTRLATQATGVGIWEWNVITDQIRWDLQMFRIYGIAPTKDGFVPYSAWSESVLPEELQRQEELLQETVRQRGHGNREFQIRRNNDGEIRSIHAVETIRTNDEGQVEWVLGTNLDITERKRAEEKLRESEAQMHLGVEVADFAICEIDYATDTNHLSKEAAQMFGLGSEAMSVSREQVHATFYPDERDKLAALIEQSFDPNGDGWFALEHRIVHKNGEVRWLNVRKQIYFDRDANPPRPIKAILAVQDITERKQAEEELRASEEFNRMVLESSPDCVKIIDAAGRLQFMNVNGLCQMEIDDFDSCSGKLWWDLWTEETQPVVKESVEKALHGETANFQAFCPTAKGTPKWWDVIVSPIPGVDDRPTRLISVSRDITESKQAEEKLRESEARFRAVFDSIDEGFCIIEVIFDENGKPVDYLFEQANPAFLPLTGLPADSVGKTARELIPNLEEFWFETYGKVALTGESIRFENFTEGLRRWFDVYASRIGGEESRRVAVVFNNITERKKAEAEIEIANFRFRVAESAVKGFHYEWNINSGEVTRSESFERVTGYRREEIEKSWSGWTELIHPNDSTVKTAAEGIEFINNLVEDSFGGEYRIKHKQGHYLWVLERGAIIRDAQGKISRVIGQMIDITDRKETQEKLLEAERRAASDYRQLLSRIAPLAQTLGTARELSSIYRALLEFIRFETPCEGFFVSFYEDKKQLKRVKYVWCEGAELDADQLKPITLGNGANSRAIRTKKSVAATRYLDKMNGEFEVIGKDDRSSPVYSLVTPMIVMGRVIGTIEVQNHERKYVQENIVALEMAANLAAVAIENVRLMNIESKARNAAEEANRSKDEFLAVLSHELRTPLNSIKGWVSMLQNHDLDETRRNQAVEVISRNVNSQNALIEDILDVSRIISGKMRLEIERISFVSVVQNALDALRPIAEKKGINLTAEIDALADEMNGDSFRLQQIINNLLNNAVKFTPEDGVINVRLERFGDTARLTVADTGIGIEPELLPRVFDRFQQADGTTRRKYNGLGLGLAIVKHLTELHGGAVFADSAGKNKGTIFTVELPLMSQMVFLFPDKDEAAANDLFEKSSLLAGLKLLIVDDEPDTLEMMRFALQNFGAEVTGVDTARKALEKLDGEKFDALISDVGMAEMDGCDLIRHIREKIELDAKTLPAIALSGYVSADDRERSLNAGFQKHLGKPVDVKTLPHEIKALIEK